MVMVTGMFQLLELKTIVQLERKAQVVLRKTVTGVLGGPLREIWKVVSPLDGMATVEGMIRVQVSQVGWRYIALQEQL
jgi:hypothetical protein